MNKPNKTGVWLIGAYGDIATTLIVGSQAIRMGMASNTGLVTSLNPLDKLDLIDMKQLVFGGHDVVDRTLFQQVQSISIQSRTFSTELVHKLEPQLAAIDKNIYPLPELAWQPSAPDSHLPSLKTLNERLRKLIRSFIQVHSLDRVIIFNLASAEPYLALNEDHAQLDAFESLLENDRKDQILPSMLCAYVALQENCPFINFTPNLSISIGALKELAKQKQGLYYGNDGKTGETLVKTALAPMFAARNLRVLSWEGTNLLGNNDGQTLEEAENRKNKIHNKEASLNNILGYPLHTGTTINYVPSLGDWKTAWDLIHFQGFLDVPMSMQFTWQGCDSILAAPLVLDMIRLADYAARHDEYGPMHHLACFFKNPLEIEEHSLYKQYEMLLKYAYQHIN